MSEGENIIPINIEDEMKSAYIDYSMSVYQEHFQMLEMV
jgi:DNA gyrase subunit A